MNPLAVMAVLLLVAMTALQTISPVSATIEGQEQSRGNHPEMVRQGSWTICENACTETYGGIFWKFPMTHAIHVYMLCRHTLMGDEACEDWCKNCNGEYGEDFPSPGANNTATYTADWTWGLCDCRIQVQI
eukprot:Nk52_evm1s1749 gene=Nk52_evmTU1s1749